MQVTPRIYQKQAVQAALKGLRGRDRRALVVLATGLGKTLTAALTAEEFKPKRTLFLVHNNFILDHAVDEFRLVFDEEATMAKYNGLSKNGAAQAAIVFATWQTMGSNLEQWTRDHFDLIVVDEAHHAEAETYRPVLDYFVGAKLGITATPDREDEADIRDVFGSEVVNVTLEEAIARGWLPRIEYHVVTDQSLDEDVLRQILDEIRHEHKRFTMDEVNRRLFIRKRDEEIARMIDGYDEKAVVFCADIEHAERMAGILGQAGSFHSRTGESQREAWDRNLATLDALGQGVIRRVCAVNAFNEGVNVPSVGLVAFCRSTQSDIVFRQQLGRGLRPGKEKLVVLDFVGNLERIRLVREMTERIADLHERFSSERELDREGYKRERIEVSGRGFEFTFSDEIVDLMEVLGHCEVEFYPTWQEASAAAIGLGIKTRNEYDRRYKEDPRLPSTPYQYYPDFPGFMAFLGKEVKEEPYPTWQEASAAAIGLGIKSQSEYKERYKEDLRLPGDPYQYYPDFPGLGAFLGKEKRADLYPTWQEASAAAIGLGIKTKDEYKERYKEDPRLLSHPHGYYPDFPGFMAFLGKEVKEEPYPTWQEASAAAIGLGIKTKDEYKERYKEDPRLPSTPYRPYPDFPGFTAFLGKEKRADLYPTWQEASAAAIGLGIKTKDEYKERYKEDPRLPSTPYKTYSDFPDFPAFFGKNG